MWRHAVAAPPMHRSRLTGTAFVAGVTLAAGMLCDSPARGQQAPDAPMSPPLPGAVESLAWLAGCWARTTAEPGSGEQWTPPAGGTMLGTSRTVRDGLTVEYEFVVIRANDSGQLAYFAHPSGQAAAAFPLLRLGAGEVVFENPTHDFPQRVGYRLESGGDALLAWIEGTSDGRTRRVEFPMTRTACAGTPGRATAGDDDG